MSVSLPWQQSWSNLQLFDGEKSVTWTGWGSEVPLFDRTGHKAFQFSSENEVLGWESGSLSYVLDFIADDGSETVTLTLKRNSAESFEVRLPFSPSPISSCNLLGRPRS